MSILTKAPLLEVITELRWGKVPPSHGLGEISFQFSADERDFFPGQFNSAVKEIGFSFHEAVNSNIPMPHLVKHRFRAEPDCWPCYQIGDGIMTVNQVNEGYDWEKYKKDVIAGLEILDKSHPDTLTDLPILGIELRYQDGFFLEEGESSAQFLQEKFNFDLKLPEQYLKPDYLGDEIQNSNVSFAINSMSPLGIVVVNIKEAIINGKPGFVMEVLVRSADAHVPTATIDDLSVWLEDAHKVQRHAFKTLINPAFAETFK